MNNREKRSILILFNIAKMQNFGSLIRTANAFGSEVVFVGKRDYSRCGATAKTRRTPTTHFFTLPEACEYVRDVGAEIVGVEIMETATAVNKFDFADTTAFMIGNEGTGLTDFQKDLCDRFVYIPQYGTAVSLNVNVATGIVLHHFAAWANFPETRQSGHKFETDFFPDDHEKKVRGKLL